MPDSIIQAVRDASLRTGAVRAVHEIYGELQRQIEIRRPICVVSGRCCRFEEFGHRLYVTTLELAAFVADYPINRPIDGVVPGQWDGTGCPFQVNKLCGVHIFRPFGCRLFFCDATAAEWQQEQYQALHARIREVHEVFGVPYHYMEWRQALREVIFPCLGLLETIPPAR
jgi:Fe-S-cluster containining protein